MNVAIFEVKAWEQGMLKKELSGMKLLFFKNSLDKVPLRKYKQADIISTFIGSEISKKTIQNLSHLKLITTRSTGFDHIDLKAAKKYKVKVANVPYYGENTVAEHAFALILDLSRNIHKAYLRIKHGNFSIEGLKGFDLQGKTIGVIGCGHIGKHVIRIAKGFGMKVLMYDVKSKISLNELLKNSDVITLHLPACKETKHIINRKNIKYIKKGAILINTARGSLVETKALIKALDKKILSGLGLDVLEDEHLLSEEHHLAHRQQNNKKFAKLIKDHKLLKKDNVIYTPHIAFYSQEAVDRITKTTIQNIKAFAKGKASNLVK